MHVSEKFMVSNISVHVNVHAIKRKEKTNWRNKITNQNFALFNFFCVCIQNLILFTALASPQEGMLCFCYLFQSLYLESYWYEMVILISGLSADWQYGRNYCIGSHRAMEKHHSIYDFLWSNFFYNLISHALLNSWLLEASISSLEWILLATNYSYSFVN